MTPPVGRHLPRFALILSVVLVFVLVGILVVLVEVIVFVEVVVVHIVIEIEGRHSGQGKKAVMRAARPPAWV